MEIDTYIRYSKTLYQPHLHIYANEEELKTLSKRHYTSLAECYDDFNKYPEIWKILKDGFLIGINYVQVKKK